MAQADGAMAFLRGAGILVSRQFDLEGEPNGWFTVPGEDRWLGKLDLIRLAESLGWEAR